MGSFDPELSAMTNIAFLGTHLINGKPANDTACVTGFDQASFMIGSSSNIFNVRSIQHMEILLSEELCSSLWTQPKVLLMA
jgi:hypothetical protein